jgi:hypothetical protein
MDSYDAPTADIEISSEGGSFKEITMRQLDRTVKSCDVEFRGGFYTKTVTKDGSEREIYVQDTREVFSNNVIILADLLRPKFDVKMEEAWAKYTSELQKIMETFIKLSTPNEEVILGDSFYKNINDKILLETYKEKKLVLHQELFREISLLLARLNYMEIGGMAMGG